MASAVESAASGSPLNAALEAGLDNISYNQTITFTKYIRLVLPLDGYVFWVRADQVSPGALLNAHRLNQLCLNAPTKVLTPAPTLVVQGAFHFMTNQEQRQDETLAINSVLFNCTEEIQDFNEIGPNSIWIGEFEGVRFAFTRRRMFFEQAGIFHYQGEAIYAAMESQIIDDVTGFDTQNVIVSNSLPMWLSLDQFMPMYPSFLVPDNIEPPYASVHIEPSGTRAIQPVPWNDSMSNHYQLVRDKVKITIYGLRNFNALDFQDYIFNYSLETDNFGLVGEMPVMRDEKRIQSELNVIAMKKVFEPEISYYQTRIRNIAQQDIHSATVNYSVDPTPVV